MPSFTASEGAYIIETGTNGAGGKWDVHTGLIDGEGLGGTGGDVSGRVKCGVSSKGSKPRAFFYMKLAKPSIVIKMQFAFRTDGATYQGKNVKVQVGNSPQYNASDPVCKEIAQLSGTGLVDYDCNQFHTGQFVIVSNDQAHLTICEAKVFVIDAGEGNMSLLVLKAEPRLRGITSQESALAYIAQPFRRILYAVKRNVKT